ncbi:MAG: sulfatase-like hydrolase/transferase [Lentisphaerae bacterium]|nr:sulfatase-like hydrolase/transferase [Lentisphaerota bacterium]
MSQKPNIILIITEQQRGDCLSSDGHPVLLTPNMDEIVANGARFSRCYSDCPICMPARRTILSGQFPATHGLLSNKEGLEWQPAATMAQVLRDQGYQTRWIGRSMHQYPQQARFGYDEVENGGSDPDSEYGSWLKANAPNDCGGWHGAGVMHNDWTARPWPLPEYLHNTNWTVERGLRFLRRRDPTCPFFLTLSFLAAHPPLQPPAPYLGLRRLRAGAVSFERARFQRYQAALGNRRAGDARGCHADPAGSGRGGCARKCGWPQSGALAARRNA